MCARFTDDSRHGEWQTSDSFTITAEQAQEIQKTLVFKEAGSGSGSRCVEQDALGYKYRNSDGSYVTNNWQQIGRCVVISSMKMHIARRIPGCSGMENGIIWM